MSPALAVGFLTTVPPGKFSIAGVDLDRFGGLWRGPRTSCPTERGRESQSRRAAELGPLV